MIENVRQHKKSYDKKANERAKAYKKEKCRMIKLCYTNREFDEDILPAIRSTGLPMATFFKKAARYYIEHGFK